MYGTTTPRRHTPAKVLDSAKPTVPVALLLQLSYNMSDIRKRLGFFLPTQHPSIGHAQAQLASASFSRPDLIYADF